MADVLYIERQYFENAKIFLLYRTGKAPAITAEQFVKTNNQNGYCKLASGGIVISLINERSTTANKIEDFRAMLKDVVKGGVDELIISFMMSSSNVPKARISAFETTFKIETAALRLKRGVLNASGLFAFNPLARAFPMDDRYVAHLKEAGGEYERLANNSLLRCGLMSDDQKKAYNFRFGLTNIPTIQQNEVECVWNNYYEGDIIYVGNLSPTTVEAITPRRVTAPVSNHIKDTQEAPEDDEKAE